MSSNKIPLEILPSTPDKYAEVLALLQKYEVQAVSIPDKSSKVDNLHFAAYLRTHFTCEVTVHYSLVHHYNRDIHRITQEFDAYVRRSLDLGISRILVVSGSALRRHTVVELLELYEQPAALQLFAAFNPYLPDVTRELARAKRKLPYVQGLYLQVGEDIDTLRNSLNRLRPLLDNHDLYGCLLYPTLQFQTRFRFRPWKGVFLSPEYLRDLNYARKIYQNYARTYRDLAVTPLLELFPLQEKSLQNALKNLC